MSLPNSYIDPAFRNLGVFERIRAKKRAAAGLCPWCGGSENIYSKYRDGGSTLYHADNLCVGGRTWRDPKHRKWSGVGR